ncbi:MAG: hypothetical protein Q9213_002288 [Squamulea squamosa]
MSTTLSYDDILAHSHQLDKPDNGHGSCRVSRSSGPKTEEWDLYRTKIQEVYLKEGLKVLKFVMKRDHGFTASSNSDRMYKTRIHKWKLNKNVKLKEMQAIVQKQAQRALAGKQSAFRLRGVEMPQHKITRFRKAAGLLSNEHASELGAATPPQFVCYTPLYSPLSTPSALVVPENAAKLVQRYVLGSIESKTWNIAQDVLWGPSLEDTISGAFQRNSVFAQHLFHVRREEHAWQVLDMTLAYTEPMLRTSWPMTLELMLFFLLDCLRSDHYQFSTPVLKHFLAMSKKVKSDNHPFTCVFQFLLNLESPKLKDVVGLLQQVQADTFAQQLGPLHSFTLRIRQRILWRNLEGVDTAKDCLALLRKVERTLGQLDPRSLQAHLFLAIVYYKQCEYDMAAQVSQNLAALIIREQRVPRGFCAIVWHTLAIAQSKLSEPILAEQHLRYAIDLLISEYGIGNEITLQYMSELENILFTLGKIFEAAKIRKQASEIIDAVYAEHKMEEEERWASYQMNQASVYHQPSPPA